MKRLFRNISLVLAALVLLMSQASAQVLKDEVVYALLSAAGEVKAIYVVNGFESSEKAQGQDYGQYSQTQALTQAESFAYKEGETTFTMAPGRFFYQGIPEGKKLPWDIAISYSLDGKEVAPDAMSGASGKVGIAFSLKPSAEGTAYSQSLAMTVTLTLDGKRAYNIQADKGTLAYAGGNVSVSYVILPGQEARYEVTADATDFAMTGLQFAAVRMGVDAAMYQNMAAKALEGTPFGAAAGGMMEQFLAGMQGQPTASFMDSRNTVRTLQFVLMSEEIPVNKPALTPEPQAEGNDTVWQRLLGLFGG